MLPIPWITLDAEFVVIVPDSRIKTILKLPGRYMTVVVPFVQAVKNSVVPIARIIQCPWRKISARLKPAHISAKHLFLFGQAGNNIALVTEF